MAYSKKCICLVLMLLLLVSMLTMSIPTAYIMCICWKVSPTYTEDYLGNCIMKCIGHHITSQGSALTQRRKEILKVILSPLVYSLKWIYKNCINQNDILCVASQAIQKTNVSPCRVKPTLLSLCHILCILKKLLYCFKFKYFVLLFVTYT